MSNTYDPFVYNFEYNNQYYLKDTDFILSFKPSPHN